ncbi:hypothetical protein CBR_g19091 [Chara braunii]|uniref:CCHC-type domain-containing protein n=1 Tax=Chara braunii TaxID=69332 RepID=A0A388KX99_CHABU|nr:hypothetical protein CBR_g19091 [Chara braunii]|eukprot:GBG74684.1 hypothetical protein CBR_g19091 [Chara braunii]
MAGVPLARDGCFHCGAWNHWVRDCPHRQAGPRPPATGANAIPTGPPLSALPAPNAVPSSTAPTSTSSFAPSSSNSQPTQSGGVGNRGYQRPNWWTRNQERLDAVYNKYVEDSAKEARRKEEEEKARIKREEEEKQLRWKKGRELFEAEMGERLDKRFEALGLTTKAKPAGVASVSGEKNEEYDRLRKENDELKRKLNDLMGRSGDEKVVYLQKDIMELRKLVTDKQVDDDAVCALKEEIRELKQSAYVKTNFEREIAGLKCEINSLREQNERVIGEAKLRKDEALRPGNKRGSVAVSTPECSGRGSPKPRWTYNIWDADKWKEDYRNLRSLHRLANIEAEALKKKRAEAEMKTMEAEKQVKQLEEEMSKLTASGSKSVEGGCTNLKDRLEEVAVRSARKGLKATPRRDAVKSPVDKTSTEINNRADFVEHQRKQLRLLRKAGLEPICKEHNVRLGKFEDTVCELAEAMANKAFPEGKNKGFVHEVSDDTATGCNSKDDGEEQSAEL